MLGVESRPSAPERSYKIGLGGLRSVATPAKEHPTSKPAFC
jgi:hypothetical protein